MKKLLFAFLLLGTAHLFGQGLSGPLPLVYPNDPTTPAVPYEVAFINNLGNAQLASTSTGTAMVLPFCVSAVATSPSTASLAIGGFVPCFFDNTVGPNVADYWVVVSTITPGYVHAQSGPPASLTGVVGRLASSSTTAGSTAYVHAAPGIYGSGGNAPGTVNYNTGGSYLTSAVQTFPCDASNCSLALPLIATPPCCSEATGIVYLVQGALTSGLAHFGFYDGTNNWVDLTSGDTPCDMNNTCTGTAGSPTVLAFTPIFWGHPFMADLVATSATYNLLTGDFLALGPGLAKVITGSVTSGTFVGCGTKGCAAQPGEAIKQCTTSGCSSVIATAVLTGPAPTGSAPLFVVNSVTGSPDNSHGWYGQTSGAKYTPTATPATPYCQASPTAGLVLICYGSDNRLQGSNNGGALSDFLLASDWASPGPIGGTTPAAGTFTTLNSTSIPSPGPIGATTPSTVKGTTANFTAMQIASILLCGSTPPSITSGGGGTLAPSVTGNSCSFEINVGTGTITNPIVLSFPSATHTWAVHCEDITTTSTTNFITKQTSSSTNSATITAYSDTATTGGTWTASDILECTAGAH